MAKPIKRIDEVQVECTWAFELGEMSRTIILPQRPVTGDVIDWLDGDRVKVDFVMFQETVPEELTDFTPKFKIIVCCSYLKPSKKKKGKKCYLKY